MDELMKNIIIHEQTAQDMTGKTIHRVMFSTNTDRVDVNFYIGEFTDAEKVAAYFDKLAASIREIASKE